MSIFDLSNVKTADDVPTVTEEGRKICGEAEVNPADLIVRNKDYFMKTAQCEEVAQIRFDHYKNKRNSKFQKFIFVFFINYFNSYRKTGNRG